MKGDFNMAKNDAGLTQLKNGNWQYRIKVKLPNGTVLDTTCRQDEDGEPFRTKTAARNARMAKLVAIKNDKSLQAKKSCTFNEVWAYYKKNDALGQAPTTQTKHDSVWRNHFVTEFGHRDINSVTISEIDNFLIRKYNTPNSKGEYLSYAYLESFIKLFYLLYGIANRWEKIDDVKFSRMFTADGTKISMPPMKQRDSERLKEIKVYEQYQLSAIEAVLKDTDAHIPFMLGFYCGLRIGECFGLMWEDVNWQTKELRINKQMQVDKGVVYLRPTKTKAGCRTIAVPPVVMDALQELHRKQFRKPSAKFRANKCEKVILVTDNKQTDIIGGDFINRRVSGPFEGCIMTPNCMKMYAKEIAARDNIHFEYHSLRRTHITQLINNGVPLKEVSKRVGHTKVSTTLKSYAGSTDETKQIMREGLQKLNTAEPMVEIPTINGGKRMVKQSEQAKLNAMLSVIPH